MMLVRAAAGSSLTPKWNETSNSNFSPAFIPLPLGRSFLTDVCGVMSRDRDSSLDRCMGDGALLFVVIYVTIANLHCATLNW